MISNDQIRSENVKILSQLDKLQNTSKALVCENEERKKSENLIFLKMDRLKTENDQFAQVVEDLREDKEERSSFSEPSKPVDEQDTEDHCEGEDPKQKTPRAGPRKAPRGSLTWSSTSAEPVDLGPHLRPYMTGDGQPSASPSSQSFSGFPLHRS